MLKTIRTAKSFATALLQELVSIANEVTSETKKPFNENERYAIIDNGQLLRVELTGAKRLVDISEHATAMEYAVKSTITPYGETVCIWIREDDLHATV